MRANTCELCKNPRREDALCAKHARDAHLWFDALKSKKDEHLLDIDAVRIAARRNGIRMQKTIRIIESYMAAIHII